MPITFDALPVRSGANPPIRPSQRKMALPAQAAGDSFSRSFKNQPAHSISGRQNLKNTLLTHHKSPLKGQSFKPVSLLTEGPLDAFKDQMSSREISDLLKRLDRQIAPETGSLLKNGETQAHKELLLIGTQVLTDMHNLRKQGARQLKLVIYYHDPAKVELIDPVTQKKKEYKFSPEILNQLSRPVYGVKTSESKRHWEDLAKQESERKAPFRFADREMALITQAAMRQGFNTEKATQRLEYFAQLLLMLRNADKHLSAHRNWNEDNDPRHYKLGIAYTTKAGESKLKDLSQLFPGCDREGYNQQPEQARLNWESQFGSNH